MELYQNYLSYIPDDIYKLLIDNNILDGLKFPGNGVDLISNKKLINLVKKIGCTVDNHGFKGITGRLHDPNYLSDKLELDQTLSEYLSLPGAGSVYSGHLGALRTQNLSKEELNKILKNNIKAIRSLIHQVNPNIETKVYGEGIFPPIFTLETTSPEFLNECASLDGMDGLVFDLCHSAITAVYIQNKKDPSYNLNHFLDDLNCDKVGIVHLSGGYKTPSNCGPFENDDIVDPHTPCNLDDFRRLFSTLERCPNVFRLSNEIAYVCLDRSVDVSIKLYIIEALLTRIAVQTRDMKALCDAMDYLFSTSFDNTGEVVQTVKRRYLTK